MADFTFNVALGRIIELYSRVKNADPVDAGLILVPLETTGIEADATLQDYDTLAALLAGASSEQTTMGRKVLVAADLAAVPAPDDTTNRRSVALPSIVWTAAAGNAISKILVCYAPDIAGADSTIVPLTAFDRAYTPTGVDLPLQAGTFFYADPA